MRTALIPRKQLTVERLARAIQEGVPAEYLYILLASRVTVSISQRNAQADQEITDCGGGKSV